MAKKYINSGFSYQKKFKPNIRRSGQQKLKSAQQKTKLYTEDWDDIRAQVYRRDGYRCVICGKKGRLHAHHIVPVRISKNNSLSNLVSVCERCHRRLEEVGFSILQNGGHQTDVRRVELQMIMEERRKRKEEYEKKLEEKKDIDVQKET